MKRLMIAAAAALMLTGGALTACAPTGEPAVTTRTTAIDEKALFAVEAAYNVTGTAYLAAVDAGVLTGARKDQVKIKLQLAYSALLAARRAYEIGDARTFAEQAAAVISATDQAKALIPSR